MQNRRVLVTGGAGFIGSHLVSGLLERGYVVTVLDNFNSAYNPEIKRKNIQANLENPRCILIEGDILSAKNLADAFAHEPFQAVIHLAAMTRVRESLAKPSLYLDVNLLGTQNIINEMIKHKCERLIFASSSVVYGKRSLEAFLETDPVNTPLSPYAASKACAELLGYTAHHTFGLDVFCLRFFNVFGPRQNPEVALQKFMRAIDKNMPIELYGNGDTCRDYVYVTDVIKGIIAAIESPMRGYEIINLARSEPFTLMQMVNELELALNKKAKYTFREAPPEELPNTFGNINKARSLLNYSPAVSFQEGIRLVAEWYKEPSNIKHVEIQS